MRYKIAISFFIATLFSAGYIHAQDNSTIGLQLPLLTLNNNDSSISSIQIISNLEDSALIGILPSAFPNVRTNVVIQEGVQSWLQNYVSEQFSNTFQPGGKQLLWAFSDLRIGKDSSSVDINSFTSLTADIYVASQGEEYQLIGNFDTVMLSKDANVDFGQNLAFVITRLYYNSLLLSASMRPAQKKTNKATAKLNNANALDTLQNTNDYAILNDTVYNTGVFTTFQEFLNDSPSVINFYAAIDAITKQVKLYKVLADSGAQLISGAWGISMRNELYCYYNNQLYAIEKRDNGFMLSKYIDYQTRKNQAFYWRSYVGEFQGDKNPFNDAHVYRAPMRNKPRIKIEATHIDMETGNIVND